MPDTDTILERVGRIAEGFKLANLEPQIAACRSRARAGAGIDVAVFGRFKAGKSSFLNHLTGRDVLPIGVVPLTAVVTRLRHGPVERATVHFLAGESRSVPVADIGLFVGEKENPDNAKRVAMMEVELPALAALAPLEFVDTPGLGSAFAHNTEAALRWLPNVGAAVVAVSSDAPLSERDLGLLVELRRHTPRIVLLLTKADLLTAAQRSEVLAFVREQMRRKWNAEGPVFFYSTQDGFGELRAVLLDKLLKPLREARGPVSEEILRHKLVSVVNQMVDYLRVALAAAAQADSARQALRARLDDERGQWELLREELHGLAHQRAASALEDYLQRLGSPCAALQAKLTAELRAQYPQWRFRLPPFVTAWREWLQGFLARELAEVSRERQAMFCEPLHKAGSHLSRAVRAFQDRLAGHMKEALGVALTPREFALEVREPSAPPVDVAYAFDAALHMAGNLVPMAIFRPQVERVLMRKARWEVEKNLSRLAAAWRDRVAMMISELTRQAEQQAMSEMRALEAMLARTESDVPALEKAIKDLEQLQN